jgi:dGTPase
VDATTDFEHCAGSHNHRIRELVELREQQFLSPFAAKSAESRGRQHEEAPDPVRTSFQRDRDRILHSKSFRRLKHKTQVFIDPEGDHYRTRLTHTLEVAQIARTIGRALRLNEDLIEAIALGHDVGHTPFGHAGESALDEAIRELASNTGLDGFRHHEQSLRIVDVLEGLNLTQETRDGIGGHSKGQSNLTAHDGQPTSTLEAAVVRISDRVAYINHDIDDALRAGIIKGLPPGLDRFGPSNGRRIGTMVEDIISNSEGERSIRLSSQLLGIINDLKDWLFDNVYLRYPVLYPDVPKARAVVKELFAYYLVPGNLPDGYEPARGAVDYVAGMTDRFAMDTYARLKLPSAWRGSGLGR